MGKTLLYVASGSNRPEYEYLDFSRIYLVDNHIRRCSHSEKVVELQCDALHAVNLLKKQGERIDCLVCLCESRGEGGQTYAMCSDAFMGYIMPILSNDFVWICNDTEYYGFPPYIKGRPPIPKHLWRLRHSYGRNYVSLDLPYSMQELTENDEGYLSPFLFSSILNQWNRPHVFRMSYSPMIEEYVLSNMITIRIINDSIWNHYEELDHLYISFQLEYPPMKDFFSEIEHVSCYQQMEFLDTLRTSRALGYSHIGYTPHYWLQYDRNYQKQLEAFLREASTPLIIDFYYLSSWFSLKHIRKAIKTIQREERIR